MSERGHAGARTVGWIGSSVHGRWRGGCKWTLGLTMSLVWRYAGTTDAGVAKDRQTLKGLWSLSRWLGGNAGSREACHEFWVRKGTQAESSRAAVGRKREKAWMVRVKERAMAKQLDGRRGMEGFGSWVELELALLAARLRWSIVDADSTKFCADRRCCDVGPLSYTVKRVAARRVELRLAGLTGDRPMALHVCKCLMDYVTIGSRPQFLLLLEGQQEQQEQQQAPRLALVVMYMQEHAWRLLAAATLPPQTSWPALETAVSQCKLWGAHGYSYALSAVVTTTPSASTLPAPCPHNRPTILSMCSSL